MLHFVIQSSRKRDLPRPHTPDLPPLQTRPSYLPTDGKDVLAKFEAGWVKGVEGEDKQGKRLCEVKIVDETGKRHKLHVDVATNQVVKAK